MPNPVDNLKDTDRLGKRLALVYGEHIGQGFLVMTHNSGAATPGYVNKLRHALCEGVIDSITGTWYDGLTIAAADVTLYDGSQTAAPAAPFAEDQPHFKTAMCHVTLPAGVGASDPEAEPPGELVVRIKGLELQDYDEDGDPDGPPVYSVNPAMVVADLVHTRGALPTAKTDWGRWNEWKDFFETTESADYTAITGLAGIGVTASFYNDTTMTTQVGGSVIIPSPYLDMGTGSPAYGINPDGFSVKMEGKIRAKTTGTYTFTVTHDDGVRVYVNNLVTPIIDQWGTIGTHTGTIALTADTFYDFKVEWFDTSSVAYCKLSWTPPGGVDQMIPKEQLYPKTETVKKYELHALYEQENTLDEAVRHALLLTNSFRQEADGKTHFYCHDEITESIFDFDESNIRDDFKFYERDARNVANHYEAVFRHLKHPYLKPAEPNAIKEFQDLKDDMGRIVRAEVLDLDSTTYPQAQKILDHVSKKETEMRKFCEFSALASSYKVLPGDVVTVTHTAAGWAEKYFLVLEAIDFSPETTADRRYFVLLEWTLGGEVSR